MKDYLLYSDNTLIHYFYKPGTGLCRKAGPLLQTIVSDRIKSFSVIQSPDSGEEILYCTEKNELIFHNPARSQAHTLTRLTDGMDLLKLRLFENSHRLHFLYSASYKGELLLVYSPIDNNALPKTLAKLRTPDFHLHNSSLYFTAQSGVLGYADLSRSEFSFNRITENALFPYLFSHNRVDYLLYKKGDEIFVQNRPICREPFAEAPIIFAEHDLLCVMWRANGFVKYCESHDYGKSWSNTMRILTSAHDVRLGYVISDAVSLRYIENHGNSLRLLGPGKQAAAEAVTVQKERRQQQELERLRAELSELKSQLGLQ